MIARDSELWRATRTEHDDDKTAGEKQNRRMRDTERRRDPLCLARVCQWLFACMHMVLVPVARVTLCLSTRRSWQNKTSQHLHLLLPVLLLLALVLILVIVILKVPRSQVELTES